MVKLPLKAITEVYTGFMEEVKMRLRGCQRSLQYAVAHRTEPDVYLHVEFCYLQLRRTCELIALAVLVAHNGLESFRNGRVLKEWNADTLFKMLERLSPRAFPAAADYQAGNQDGEPDLVINREGHLTKEELAKIYNDAGQHLHAGSLHHLATKGRKPYDVLAIREACNRLIQLLDCHVILMPENKTAMIVVMQNTDDEKVFCAMHALRPEET